VAYKIGAVKPILALTLIAAAGLIHPAAAQPPVSAAVQAHAEASQEAVLRLAERLRRLEDDGLDPRFYDIPGVETAAGDPTAFRQAVFRAAQFALTDLLHGRVGALPGRSDIRRDIDLVPLGPWMAELLASREPAAVIERASLLHPDARALRAELARLRALAAAGGTPTIPGNLNTTLEPGATDPVRVPALRARLAVDMPALARGETGSPVYDTLLQDAVRRFQEAEGLEADARVGRLTWQALNRPVEQRIRQLRVALDMRRAAGPPPAERRIEVNIPFQRLQMLEGTREILAMNTVVGRPDRQTPMLNVRLTAVQFNPPWGVPVRNAREDLLPRFRANPDAMIARGFRLFQRVEGEVVEVDPRSVDWTAYSRNHFPYSVRQDAGDANALGRIKFVMPNGEDIFMHDTPDRHYFRRGARFFSSGCIRLERPMELLELVLQGTPGWDRPRVDRALGTRVTSSVGVARTLPVRLHYTSVLVEDGRVLMRADVYGLDEAYARAMERGRGTRVAAAGAR